MSAFYVRSGKNLKKIQCVSLIHSSSLIHFLSNVGAKFVICLETYFFLSELPHLRWSEKIFLNLLLDVWIISVDLIT